MHRLLPWLVGIALACVPEYPYVPTTTTSATIVERRIDQPRGTLEVESYGIAEVTPPGETKPVNALKVRAVLTNPTAEKWTFDTREQRVEVTRPGPGPGPGPGAVAALTALGRAIGLPLIVTVEPRSTQTVDLYYPAPTMDPATELPGSLEVVSTVHSASGVMMQRTLLGGVGTNQSTGPFWLPLFPFFPFGLSKSWAP
jgi:hypothetical protein